jgi:hypothetical protein
LIVSHFKQIKRFSEDMKAGKIHSLIDTAAVDSGWCEFEIQLEARPHQSVTLIAFNYRGAREIGEKERSERLEEECDASEIRHAPADNQS